MPPAEYVDLPIYHDELASALGFTPSDLEANRAGRLTASQRAAGASWPPNQSALADKAADGNAA